MVSVSEVLKKKVFDEYKRLVNMSPVEYKKFLGEKWSIAGRRNARDNRLIKRNKVFISKPFSRWRDSDVLFALKIINRVKALKKMDFKGKVGVFSLKTVKLLNFGHKK